MKLHWIASFGLALWASIAQAGSSSPWELKASLAFSKEASEYLLVYTSNEITSGPNVWGRLLHADATPIGIDFRLSTQPGKMTKPVVAYNPGTQRFLVVWGRKLGDRAEIVGLDVGLDGKPVGDEFRISISDLFDQRASVAYCPGQDRFLVTWTRGTQYDFEKGISDIFGQVVAGDGTSMKGGNFAIASAAKNQFKSEVACDAVSDRFLVVWEDQRNLATQDDIYGQLIATDGTLLGSNFLVSGTADIERRPVVAANTRRGGYLVAWESDDAQGDNPLYSQTIDPNGVLLGQPVAIGAALGGNRDRPAVAYLKLQDEFLVAFDNTNFDGISDGVYAQFVDGNGRLRETAFPLTTAKTSQYRPDVKAATDSFLVVWTDYRDTVGDRKHDVYEYFGRMIGNDMPLSSRWRNPDSE